MSTSTPPSKTIKTSYQINSVFLNRNVELEIFSLRFLPANGALHLLLLNDGQEATALQLEDTLSSLHTARKIEDLVIVAIKAGTDRIQEYGVAGSPDFSGRGSKAGLYTDFIVKELLPFIDTIAGPFHGKRCFAGFSLGGISAFDISWNNNQVFDAAGVFSGSFWWRTKDLDNGYTDQDRIVHQMIRNTPSKPVLKFWLMTGTDDETSDRNNNFIIDSIDDTIDVIKELENKGYRRPADIFYYEMVGGQHNVTTWAKAIPAFLIWAFPRQIDL